MKRHLRNLTLICVVLTVCLAGVAVGYGHWTETLGITGTTVVENLAIVIFEQETNDPPGHNYVPGIPGADETIMDGFIAVIPSRLNKDVGWTECYLFDTDEDGYADTCEFTMQNVYPCYMGKIILTIWNLGDLNVQIDSVDVIYPETPEFNYSSPPTMKAPWPHPPEFEVKWFNGSLNLPIIIGAGDTTTVGAMVHVLQPAAQNSTYTFQVTFHVSGPV